MISAFGAILLIAAGGYAGFSALEHLRTAPRSAETNGNTLSPDTTSAALGATGGAVSAPFPGCRKRMHARS